MNLLLQPPPIKLEPRQRFVLWNIGWKSYELIVEALNEQHVRSTYDRGDLELMSLLPIHERIKVWFGHFLLMLSLELHFAYQTMSQTTFRRRDRDRGLEPDDCYYLASLGRVADWNTLNLDRDPPPDLALEIDVTTSCLDRMGVYAGLGVPEVWRFDGEDWHIHLLGPGGVYQESQTSAALPYLPIPEITTLLGETRDMTDNSERFRVFSSWIRERVMPLYQAWQLQTPPTGANS